MSEEDWYTLNGVCIELCNLARRNGYPADLVKLHNDAQATLAAYKPTRGQE